METDEEVFLEKGNNGDFSHVGRPSVSDIEKIFLEGDISGDVKYFLGLTQSDLHPEESKSDPPVAPRFTYGISSDNRNKQTLFDEANPYSSAERIFPDNGSVMKRARMDKGFPRTMVIGESDTAGKFITYAAKPKYVCCLKGFKDEKYAKLQKRKLIINLRGFGFDRRWVKSRVFDYPVNVRRNGGFSEEKRYAVSVDTSGTPKDMKMVVDSALEKMCTLYKPIRHVSSGLHV